MNDDGDDENVKNTKAKFFLRDVADHPCSDVVFQNANYLFTQ
jgi:hypothetical protein